MNCWSLRCSWSITCRRCSTYISFLDLTPGLNGLGKNICETRREACHLCECCASLMVDFEIQCWIQYPKYSLFGSTRQVLMICHLWGDVTPWSVTFIFITFADICLTFDDVKARLKATCCINELHMGEFFWFTGVQFASWKPNCFNESSSTRHGNQHKLLIICY